MKKERDVERYHTASYTGDIKKGEKKPFEVFDATTDQLIGYLMNLSSNGMMIQSKESIKESSTYEFRVDLPMEVNGSDQFVVSVKSIWSKENDNPIFYNNGFEVLDNCPYMSDVIAVLFHDKIPSTPET